MLTRGSWACRFTSTRSPLGSRWLWISPSVACAGLPGRPWAPARRRDNDPVEPFGDEIAAGHVADLLGGDFLDLLDVLFPYSGSRGGQEVAAQPLGRLLGGLAGEDQLGRLLLLGLGQLGRADQLLAQAIDLAEDFLGGLPPRLGPADGLATNMPAT